MTNLESMVVWHDVVSSNILAIAYDLDTRTLFIQFKDGDRYRYADVSVDVFDGLLFAKSVGKYFHANIRGQYPTVKVN